MTIRVAVLDDNDRFRQQVIDRLGYFPSVIVVLEAASVDRFVEQLDALDTPPDVALLDIELPEASGIELAARLTAEYPAIGVLMFTVFEAEHTVLAAIQAGASGYLLKDASAELIVRSIHEVHDGGVPLSRSIARQLLAIAGRQAPAEQPDLLTSMPPASDPLASGERLSRREETLLHRIVLGETEAQIAEHLNISPHTVRTHVKNIYRKLRVRSRAAAVRLALERQRPRPAP